jgi:hypothetical protein
LSWLFISYQLTLVAFMPLFGKLGDIYGRKRTIQSSIVLFVAASVFTGLATNFPMLILGRALQGVGGGGIYGPIAGSHRRHRPAAASRQVRVDHAERVHVTVDARPVARWTLRRSSQLALDLLHQLPLGVVAWFIIAVAFQVPSDRVRHHVDIVGHCCSSWLCRDRVRRVDRR